MAMACVHFNFLGNILPLQRPAFAGRCNLLCLGMAVRSRVKLGGLHDYFAEALGFLYTGHEATSHPHLFRDGLNCVLWECPMFLPLCPASKLRPWLSPARHAALRLIPRAENSQQSLCREAFAALCEWHGLLSRQNEGCGESNAKAFKAEKFLPLFPAVCTGAVLDQRSSQYSKTPGQNRAFSPH